MDQRAWMNRVEKPARYIGREYNSVVKDPAGKIRYAFCFPDVYEVGMSHLGTKILYHTMNEREDTYCERVFAPWVDMEKYLRETKTSLWTLETGTPLAEMDLIGFTLQYEMTYTNLLNMLELGGVPLLARDRKNGPFVMAGGPVAMNAEPLSDFVDFFVLGDGEEMNHEVLDAYRDWKASGAPREAFLEAVAGIRGVYVPSFYDVDYDGDGVIRFVKPNHAAAPERIRKRVVWDLDSAYFPTKVIVPYTEPIHDRIMLEIFRGCSRGCRFCQAGMIYRPVRERSLDRLMELAGELVKNTGYEEISLTSLSSGDYSRLLDLARGLMDRFSDKQVALSLPSLRLDSVVKEAIGETQRVRKSSLTFAPEAGTQRMRDIINKNVTEEDLIKSATDAFEEGYTSLKLYFMIGLPGETMEDVAGIADLARKVVAAYQPYRSRNGKPLRISISTASFVPKPHTPFQWFGQNSRAELVEKQQYLAKLLKIRGVEFSWHDPSTSFLEAVFARGDRRLGKTLLQAFKKGCRFDGWMDQFRLDLWEEAFKETGIDPAFYANRTFSFEETLAWDHLDMGVNKTFFKREWDKAMRGETTPDCRGGCLGCGFTKWEEGCPCA